MENIVHFATGLILGMTLVVCLTLVVSWTREQLRKQWTFATFTGHLHQASESMRGELARATDSMRSLFTQEFGNRQEMFGTISEQLRHTSQQTHDLLAVSNALHHALSHPAVRGQWGERMLEDVLNPAGFEAGINYTKQTTIAGAGRPDYTLLLPRGLKVNLDCKFPLDNYLAFYAAQSEFEREQFKKRFLADVRRRFKEVASKNYINAEENTVDIALLFIPNEQVYSFVNAYDPSIFDDAMRNKVILCSPWTVYPVVSIIRLAIDNFILEKTTVKLLPLMSAFQKQWDAFNDCQEKMGRRIADTQKEYEQLVTTRQRQLDRILNHIETLRQETNFHAVEASQ